MALPPTFEIEFTGTEEKEQLQYALLAFDELGLNPFKPREIADFLGITNDSQVDFSHMTTRKAAMWIRAGMKFRYIEGGDRFGQQLPSVDWVLARVTRENFCLAFGMSIVAAGLNSENGAGAESGDADPPTA